MFLMCVVLGLALIGVFFLFGEIFDSFEIGDGMISAISIGAGLTLFGATGLVLSGSGLNELAIAAIAAGVGLLSLVGSGLSVRRLRKDSINDADIVFVGKSARVTSAIEAGGYGEISVNDPRVTDRYVATSQQDLPIGSTVLIIRKEGTALRVVTPPSNTQTNNERKAS